jgi:hypothetical protein
MPLQIRRGTEAERTAMPQPLSEGELLYVTDQRRLFVGDGVTVGGLIIGVDSDEAANDTAAEIFVNDTHTGVTFTYNDTSNIMTASVNLALDNLSNIDLQTAPTNGQVLKYDTTSSKWIAGDDNSIVGTTGLQELVEDLTPQLGGTLDLNNNDINGVGNIDIVGELSVSSNITANSVSTNSIIAPVSSFFIGTSTDSTDLTFYSNKIDIRSGNASSDIDNIVSISLNASRDSVSSPSSVELADIVGGINFNAFNGTSFETKAFIGARIESAPNGAQLLPGAVSIAIKGDGAFIEYEFTSSGALITPILQVGEYATSSLPLSGSEAKGMIVFDNTDNQFKGWNGSAWVVLG